MTDARFPERWLNDKRILRLKPPVFRTFVLALTWSVANRTDGVIEDDDLALIPGASAEHAGDLASAGVWERGPDRWTILDFEDTQTSKSDLEVLANARRAARDKKRRQRARDRDGHQSPGTVPGDEMRDSTRTGQDRTGQAAVTPSVENAEVDVEPGWPSITAASSSSTQEGESMRCPCGTRLSDYYVKVGRKACPGHEGMVGAA